jgi:hypothetical protein
MTRIQLKKLSTIGQKKECKKQKFSKKRIYHLAFWIVVSINEKGQWDGKLVKETNFKQPNNTKFVPEASLDKTPYKDWKSVFQNEWKRLCL